MAQQERISLREFQNRFSSEEACRDHLFNLRWPEGFVCSRCNHTHAYPIKNRRLYQCASCRYQASVTAGSVFHKTRVPLQVWFWAIFLAAHDKRGVSAQMLHRELDISYPTAWLLLHKIRKAMRDRDTHYTLAGIVELDDSYFGAPTEGGKRGRGTEKIPVVVGVSLTRNGHPLHAKMQVVDDLKTGTLRSTMQNMLLPGANLVTDAYRSYTNAAKGTYTIEATKFDPVANPDHLKWIHTIISNAKAFIAGTYHGLGRKHLQAYLDEYCYRFSRRKFVGQGFNRLLTACLAASTITYAELT